MPATGSTLSLRMLAVSAAAALAVLGCHKAEAGPGEALGRFFDTAVQQDYAATWQCYDRAYRAKVDQQEFVRHRSEASRLQAWRLLSLERKGDQAEAVVELDFAPSPRLNRTEVATRRVVEQMVLEPDGWRIKVW